jgi:hypothetical protein
VIEVASSDNLSEDETTPHAGATMIMDPTNKTAVARILFAVGFGLVIVFSLIEFSTP